MGAVWSAEQVIGLAPDAGSARAGRDLSAAGKWVSLGSGDGVLWGECRGSGASPYQTKIDLDGPAFGCSCPSRKFPCKHALGLFLLWVNEPGLCTPGGPPAWVGSWLESRSKRAEQKAEKTRAKAEAPADPEAARKREAARLAKVRAGLDDLGLWLADLVRQGLASVQGKGAGFWEEPARRLVDAQAPGLARRVRQIEALPLSGDGWPSALLDRLGRLHLAVEGRKRLDDLPPGVQADLRSVIGLPVDQDSLRAGPGVRDVWQVVGQRVEVEDRLRTRRTWLTGRETGRPALVLDFAHGANPLDAGLPPGACVDADLAFFAGSAPLRALVQARHAPPAALDTLTGHADINAAHDAYARALAANPWLELYPLVLTGAVLEPFRGSWRVRDRAGGALAVSPRFGRGWHVLAVSGGRPVGLAGEFDGAALEPLAFTFEGRFRPIAAEASEPSPPGTAPVDAPADLAGIWREASASALVGVERRRPPAVAADDPLSAVLQGVGGVDPPARLLGLAAAAAWYGHVGRKPATDPAPPPEPCGVDDRPECGPAPSARFGELLGSESSGFLPEWLDLLAASGARLPGDRLPEALNAAKGQSHLRDAVRAVLGARGRWLASKNPEWGFVGGEADTADPSAVWETGTLPERRAALKALRATDPARALRLVTTTWADDPADARAAFVEGLAVGLGMDDEPFLEAALDDRSKGVRRAAADLLVTLPGSRLCHRMAGRAGRGLRWDGRGFAVSLPEARDAAMVRDGVDEEPPRSLGLGGRAYWLFQAIGATPPPAWCEIAGVGPAPIIASARGGEWHPMLWAAWATAATRSRDAEWARALLLDAPESSPITGPVWHDLLATVPAADRDLVLRRRLAADDRLFTSGHPAFYMIDGAKGPLGTDLARDVLLRVCRLVEAEARQPEGARPDPAFQDYRAHLFLTNLAYVFPTALLAEAERGRPGDASAGLYYAGAYRTFLDRLRFRHEMHREFDR